MTPPAAEGAPGLPLAGPGARAVLVGCGRYTAPGLPRVDAAGPNVTDLAATLELRCGMASSAITVLQDPGDSNEIGLAAAEAAEAATDVLLFYFVGHGQVSDEGELYLCGPGTDPRPAFLPYSALRYNTLRDSLLAGAARSRLVILDCCFSGRAVETLSVSVLEDQAADLARVDGGCVLAAAARDQLALAPRGWRYTAFTGELLEFLRLGDPAVGPELTVRDVFRHLQITLQAKGLPNPRRRSSQSADDLVLAPNPAFRPPAPEPGAAAPRPSPPPAPPDPAPRPEPSETAPGTGRRDTRPGAENAIARVARGAGLMASPTIEDAARDTGLPVPVVRAILRRCGHPVAEDGGLGEDHRTALEGELERAAVRMRERLQGAEDDVVLLARAVRVPVSFAVRILREAGHRLGPDERTIDAAAFEDLANALALLKLEAEDTDHVPGATADPDGGRTPER